jgi:hypothetical protein
MRNLTKNMDEKPCVFSKPWTKTTSYHKTKGQNHELPQNHGKKQPKERGPYKTMSYSKNNDQLLKEYGTHKEVHPTR